MTTSETYTPGPWAYDVESEAVFVNDGDVAPNIAFLSDNTSSDRNLADGMLIAAAPDLLAAAIALCAPYSDLTDAQLRFVAEGHNGEGITITNISVDTAKAVIAFRAAIAKAGAK
jgi:hypothetical protein